MQTFVYTNHLKRKTSGKPFQMSNNFFRSQNSKMLQIIKNLYCTKSYVC